LVGQAAAPAPRRGASRRRAAWRALAGEVRMPRVRSRGNPDGSPTDPFRRRVREGGGWSGAWISGLTRPGQAGPYAHHLDAIRRGEACLALVGEEPMPRGTVGVPGRPYPVIVGQGALQEPPRLVKDLGGAAAAVVSG